MTSTQATLEKDIGVELHPFSSYIARCKEKSLTSRFLWSNENKYHYKQIQEYRLIKSCLFFFRYRSWEERYL